MKKPKDKFIDLNKPSDISFMISTGLSIIALVTSILVYLR